MKTNDIRALVAKATEMEDQTVVTTFTGGSLATEGKTVGRFVEYVELGKQPRKYNGKPKDPADQVRLVFELNGPKNRKDIEHEGETKTITERIYLTLTKSNSDKSGYYKLLDKMRYGREDITHMAQMLGEGFVITVVHRKSDDGKKTYANVSGPGGAWFIDPPFNEDAVTNKRTAYKIPEPSADVKVFLFNVPTQESWDSLFIDGTFEDKDDKGNKRSKSKNFIQETIMKATNFPGSELEAMLAGGIETHVDEDEEVTEELEASEEVEMELQEETMEVEEELEVAAPAVLPPPFKKVAGKTTTVAKPVTKAPIVAKANAAVSKVAVATKVAPKPVVKAAKNNVVKMNGAKTAPAADPFEALGLSE